MKRTTSRRTIRLTESKLRQIIKSVLLEGGIPKLSSFPTEDYDREEVELFNSYWVKFDPVSPPDGFTAKEGPFDPSVVQLAADILSTDEQRCNPEDLLIYLPKKDKSYDEDQAMVYADAFLAGVDPDVAGENMNGYVLLDDAGIRYLYTCEEVKEEVDRLNSYWVKVEPAFPSVGFTPKEDPFDFSAVQAAKILGCKPKQLYVYLPEDEYENYDEDKARKYANAYLAGVDPDVVGENMNGYVLLDVIVPGTRALTQRYIYTCKEQEENNAAGIDQENEEQLKTMKNKNLMTIKSDEKQKTQENKMRRPTRNPMRLTESRLRKIIRSVIDESYFG